MSSLRYNVPGSIEHLKMRARTISRDMRARSKAKKGAVTKSKRPSRSVKNPTLPVPPPPPSRLSVRQDLYDPGVDILDDDDDYQPLANGGRQPDERAQAQAQPQPDAQAQAQAQAQLDPDIPVAPPIDGPDQQAQQAQAQVQPPPDDVIPEAPPMGDANQQAQPQPPPAPSPKIAEKKNDNGRVDLLDAIRKGAPLKKVVVNDQRPPPIKTDKSPNQGGQTILSQLRNAMGNRRSALAESSPQEKKTPDNDAWLTE